MFNESPIFTREYKDYTRDFNFISLYLDQCVKYAEIQDPNLDKEKYRAWMNTQIKKGGKFPINNRKMKVVMKDKNNDRFRNIITVQDYLNDIVTQDLRFAPTFTTYRSEKVQKSLESAFLTVGMANRSKEKKLKFACKEAGDDNGAEYHDMMQVALKVLNNSSSGAKAVPSNILFNETGHSTLTSICRSDTSFANALNEKFLGGYRHFFNSDVVVENILAVLSFCDYEETERVMKKYDLHYVSQEELLTYIKRSTDLYWKAPFMFERIERVVNKMTKLECSMYLYNGDFYGLRYFNNALIRGWFDTLLSYNHLDLVSDEEAKVWIKRMDPDLAALVAMYCGDICNGKSIWTILESHPEHTRYVATVIKNTMESFEGFRELIKAFWVTDIMPAETAHVPNMMRGVVLGSDTDSSLFAVDQHWIKWFCGKVVHNKQSGDVMATAVYITSQHIAHVLGMMTGILNIAVEKRPLISMKNEFGFSSFTTTSMGKHYFAKKDSQEGIIIDKSKREAEIKGVGLKHTKVPSAITQGFHDELFNIMNAIQNDEKISILEYGSKVAKIENMVFDSIRKGECTYLQKGQVKAKDSYKVENSLYLRGYKMWEEVFAPKYGHTVEPPYSVTKVSIVTDTKKKFLEWCSTFEDQELANRLIKWIDDNLNGTPLKTIYVPEILAQSKGIPKELLPVMDPRKLVFTVTMPYYLIAESMGVFMINKYQTRLFSDDFPGMEIPESITS